MQDQVGFELSLQQEHLWDLHTAGVDARSQIAVVVGQPVSADALRAAVQRHEILRTTLAQPAGLKVPLQAVHADGALELRTDDRALEEVLADEAAQPFDLQNGPLVRAVLVPRGDEQVLVLTAAAIALDARSLELLAAEATGAGVADEPVQYADYAAWQREVLADAPEAAEEAPAVRLPLAGTPAGGPTATLPVAVSAAPAGEDGWLAAWAILVARLTGRTDVAVDVRVDGRADAELAQALGAFARDLPVRIALEEGTTAQDAVPAAAAARAQALGAQELVAAAGRGATLAGFSYAEAPQAALVARRDDGAPHQVRLECTARDGGVEAVLRYDTAAVDAAEAERIARHLVQLTAAIAEQPAADVWRLPVLPAEDRRFLEAEVAAGPAVAGTPELFPAAFAAQAAAHPDAIAVSGAEVSLTYGELDRRANRLARLLREHGVGRDAPVAVLLDRTPDLLVAVLGILKAGGAYLPLNADHPDVRLAFQVQDAGAAVLVSGGALMEQAARLEADVIAVEAASAEGDDAPVDAGVEAGDLAYIIYTSGSTGTPKGVETTHGALANYTAALVGRLGAAEQPLRFGVVTTMSTDLGNTSIFPALASGGSIELVPVDVAMDGAAYAAYVAEHPVDVLKITPSHLDALLVGGGKAVLPQRQLVIGGEAAPWSLAERVRELGGCRVMNHYGPTETTVGSLTYDVGERAGAAAVAATVPIGRPIAGTKVFVVDAHGELVPLGAPGELLIGGAGLARGYRGNPEQTAERFVSGPDGGRVYRTGDVVRVLADGSIEFLQRVDGQVKIRGYRVETGEIEAVLREHVAVAQVAVVVAGETAADQRLVAYVVAGEGSVDLATALRERARLSLPEYMVPSAVVTLDALPLTPNGKLDRAALPSPDATAEREYVAPRNDVEETIARIWAEALGLERVGAEDDFFELGGHSLLATQIIARIRNAYDIQLPLHALFTAPAVSQLALEVQAAREATGEGEEDEELTALLQELEGLSDDEAERLLEQEGSPSSTDA